MARVAGFALLLAWAGVALAAGPSASLTAKQAAARQQQEQLRERIGVLQKDIDSHEASRRDAADDLRASESAISTINRHLVDLSGQTSQVEQALDDISHKVAQQNGQLSQRQHELAEQLRAQYASGLSPWTALLSGDDPQAIGRDLSYLGYISEARADTVRAIRSAIGKLADLQAESEARHKELLDIEQETIRQKADLEQQKKERQNVLDRIDADLKQQRSQARHLESNDKRLSQLITGLDQAIAEQAEAARIAEEKRQAEAARKAEQARLAAQEQRREIERQRQAAHEAEQAARARQAQAQREQDQQEAEQARLQVEKARASTRAAEQAAQAARPAEPQAAAPAAPPGGFDGLQKGLPYPVRGEAQGHFGSERPDGGLWRGIVLRAPAGTPVHAVAAGRVVYANWLGGFGNIIIIDHGAKYLSIYAYNQSLLKRVGDTVQGGETIATVGATGGQVESGLYFEIRHQGSPMNPLLWLRH
jgi:septal ring factor EnvC (AmiA/AmiB activator)